VTTTRRLLGRFFSGEQQFSIEVTHGGHIIGQPVDLSSRIDLLNSQDYKKAMDNLRRWKPYLVTLAFPCTPWSVLQRLNFAMGNYKALWEREAHMPFLNFVRDVCLAQAKEGRLALVENPLFSAAFEQDPLQEVLASGFYTFVRGDQCAWWKRSVFGGLLQKPTGFIVPTGSSRDLHERAVHGGPCA